MSRPPTRRSRGVLRALATLCLMTCVPTSRSSEPVERASDRATAVSSPLQARALARPEIARAPSRSDDPSSRAEGVDPSSRSRPAQADAPSPRSRRAEVLATAAPSRPTVPPVLRKDGFEMTFVGDVIFGRYREDGYDPIPEEGQPVFEQVVPLLRSDLLVGNLETPLMHELPAVSPIGASYSFGADARLARYLVQGGFDAMSLANNHAYDLHVAGVEQTPEILGSLGVVPLGAAQTDGPALRVETLEREGWRIGFVALTVHSNVEALPGVPELPRLELDEIADRVTPLVEDARVSHDLVVVLVHWGDEYADEPSWYQRNAAYALVEAGADLIVGHHPHVLQGIERHGHGLIAYSLGNFLFENVKDVPRQTGVLRTRFDARGCLEAVIFHPAYIRSLPTKHPAPATGYMGTLVKERLRAVSRTFGERWRDAGDDLELRGLGCPGSPGPA